jgi:hypothetical protein
MSIGVTTYPDLEGWAKDFADESNGKIHVLILVGSPGLLKSTILLQTIGEKARWLEGTLSAFELYCEAYEHRDRMLVIDDVDELYHDKAAVRLLKCLCQTRPVKTLGWHTASTLLDKRGVPREFETRSRVCIIANEWKALNKNLGALEDRGVLISFRPNAAEVHTKANCPDKEVYDFIGQHVQFIAEASMRQYSFAVTMKAKGRNWKNYLWETWNLDKKIAALVQVLHDPNLKSEKDRETEWIRLTGSSRPTYYRCKQKLQAKP